MLYDIRLSSLISLSTDFYLQSYPIHLNRKIHLKSEFLGKIDETKHNTVEEIHEIFLQQLLC